MALTDTDILLKLGACNLLHFLSDAIGIDESNIRVLQAARFYLQGKKDELISVYTELGVKRALEFVEQVGIIEDVGYAEDIYFKLIEVEKIDSGEAILFAGAIDDPNALIVTGDKNSLRALTSTPDIAPIANQVRGRVICFEQLLLELKNHIGYSNFRDRVVPARGCDRILEKIVFGNGIETPEQHVVDALSSYAQSLHAKTGLLWER